MSESRGSNRMIRMACFILLGVALGGMIGLGVMMTVIIAVVAICFVMWARCEDNFL